MAAEPTESASRTTRKVPPRDTPSPVRNSIRPAPRREAAPTRVRQPAPSPPKESPKESPKAPPNELERRAPKTPHPVPEEVTQRFVQVGRKYYFTDGAHAFTDRGKRLSTPSENTEVIRSLVHIAEHRGWSEIQVTGTERFRKEAWMAAKTLGLDVRGYKPTTLDQERLVRQVARREGKALSASEAPAPTRAVIVATPDPVDEPQGKSSDSRWISGRLVDYGRAPYKHDRHEPMSFYVKVETDRGERLVWGVDLERALKQSLTQVQLGDAVGLQSRGQEAVVVRTRERDAAGRIVAEKPLDTHRNQWVIEKTEFFDARAAAAETLRDPKVRPKDAVKRHPELTGTYLYLKSAEEFAQQKIRDPADQKRFVAGVRQALAHSIAQGEPLAPVRVKDTPPARSSDRAPAPKSRRPDLVRE